MLNEIILSVMSKGDSDKVETITADEFTTGLNILAGQRKKFRFPWPEALPFDEVTIEYDFLGKGDREG